MSVLYYEYNKQRGVEIILVWRELDYDLMGSYVKGHVVSYAC
jgi:hypothetical protein